MFFFCDLVVGMRLVILYGKVPWPKPFFYSERWHIIHVS